MSTITTIEDFSNEIFYEVFDYLYGNDIYKAFSILNYRFDQLLHCPFQYKIQIDKSCIEENTMDELMKISHHIRKQILSISISTTTGILSLCNFDSTYKNLQCLILNSLTGYDVALLLHKLTNLPQLYSLTIQTSCESTTGSRIRTIYSLVFNLSKLKYFKLNVYSIEFRRYFSLPIVSHKQQLTSIEHLIVDHRYTFEQLIHLLSYTPKVHHLKFIIQDLSPINLTLLSQIQLINLTSLSITVYFMLFDTFQRFINHFGFNLKKFSSKIVMKDENYFIAHRWERLILKSLSKLEEFSMKYSIHLRKDDDDHQPSLYSVKPNEFYSPFWLQRQWLLEIEVRSHIIIYFIHPYKKRWYEFDRQEKSKYSFEELSKSRQLTRNDIFNKKLPIYEYRRYILPVMQIDHLDIRQEIFVVELAEILCLLSELDSLKLSKISFFKPRQPTPDELVDVFLSTSNTKITKVCLEKLDKIEEVYFILSLCPLTKQLQINDLSMIDVQYFLRSLLIQIKNKSKFQNLQLICIRLPTVDDKIIFKLKQIIEDHKLLDNFTIKNVEHKIYLQWK